MLRETPTRSTAEIATERQGTVTVTMRAIVQRINRKLAAEGYRDSSNRVGGRGSISIATWVSGSSSMAAETKSSRRMSTRRSSPRSLGCCSPGKRCGNDWMSAVLECSGGVTMERKGKKSKGKATAGYRFDVLLRGGGDQRLAVARVFNEISGIKRVGAELQEIFSRPTPIKEDITRDEAAQIKRRIEEAGGSVKITPARG